MLKYLFYNISVAYPSSQVSYRWHNPTLAVGYEGELQLSQFDIINTKYRQVNFSRDATGESQVPGLCSPCLTQSCSGTFSVLQVIFLLQRHTGYFLIQARGEDLTVLRS